MKLSKEKFDNVAITRGAFGVFFIFIGALLMGTIKYANAEEFLGMLIAVCGAILFGEFLFAAELKEMEKKAGGRK